ncbi:MAG: thioredoxin fold domain-containing protein [Thermoanaerobaculia bacterium]
MDAEVYPDSRVESLVRGHFVPVRIHVRDENAAALMERFGANWTPTIVFLDPDGSERHRIEGFLPTEDFLAQLMLGLGRIAMAAKKWDEAERDFAQILEKYPNSDSAAEALYWKGVAKFKEGDAGALGETAKAFQERYTESPWAKKSVIWR